MSSIINRRDKFMSDIMAMITSGTSNDVRIVLEDGEILANKDVLSTRSDYFATMFSNNCKDGKFVEGETNKVDMSHCSKAIMEKIVKYLFSGDMELHDLTLPDLVKMMHMTSMMMLDDIHGDIKDYVLHLIPERTQKYIEDRPKNRFIFPELVNSLMLTENFKLEDVKESLISELFLCLGKIILLDEKSQEAFKMLPVNLVKEILLKNREPKDIADGEWALFLQNYVEEDDEDYVQPDETDEDTDDYTEYDTDEGTYVDIPGEDNNTDEEDDDIDEEDDYAGPDNIWTKDCDRLSAFVCWLDGNECSDEDKKEIKDSIDLSGGSFTAEDLLTVVRSYGLYSVEEVDKSVMKIISRAQTEVDAIRHKIFPMGTSMDLYYISKLGCTGVYRDYD